jgi:hypothetical protein
MEDRSISGKAPTPPARRSISVPEQKADAPSAPKKKEGLLDLARRLLRPSPSAPGAGPVRHESLEKPKAAAEPAASRRLNGKVRRQGKRMIIEIDVTSTLKWAPGSEARIELSDGTIIKVPVLVAMTTAEGEYGLGLIVTLVLEVDERVGEPATVHLSNGSEVLEIVL